MGGRNGDNAAVLGGGQNTLLVGARGNVSGELCSPYQHDDYARERIDEDTFILARVATYA